MIIIIVIKTCLNFFEELGDKTYISLSNFYICQANHWLVQS